MISTMLKAKHWQLFLIMFVLPFFLQMGMMFTMIFNIVKTQNSDPSVVINYFRFFPVIALVYIISLFAWFWSIGVGLQTKVPQNVSMKVKKFKIMFWIPLTYILVLTSLFGIFGNTLFVRMADPDPGKILLFLAVFIPIHLGSIICIFYLMYFSAKTIKTIELQREVKFSDFIGEFFLLWFYPVGVWFLQPKINKMWENDILLTDGNLNKF